VVSGLETFPYNIVEPWTDDDNDISHYLCDMGLRFSMRGISNPNGGNNTVVYTVNITHEDATVIKLTFPGITISPCIVKEKVSTVVRRVWENITVS
jgi:hypothetical protein